jgi:hypothetical protein
MPYASPDFATFAAVFTDFADIAEPSFAYWLARAERVIDNDYGDDQLHATMLLTAHYLATQGFGAGTEAKIAGFAGATRVKSGDLELGWSDRAAANSTGPTTRYMAELRGLVLAAKGGPGVAGTGTFPPVVNYGLA